MSSSLKVWKQEIYTGNKLRWWQSPSAVGKPRTCCSMKKMLEERVVVLASWTSRCLLVSRQQIQEGLCGSEQKGRVGKPKPLFYLPSWQKGGVDTNVPRMDSTERGVSSGSVGPSLGCAIAFPSQRAIVQALKIYHSAYCKSVEL